MIAVGNLAVGLYDYDNDDESALEVTDLRDSGDDYRGVTWIWRHIDGMPLLKVADQSDECNATWHCSHMLPWTPAGLDEVPL